MHDWMKNGPWLPEDLDNLAGTKVSRNIMESVSYYANLTKDILAVIDSKDDPKLAGLVDQIAAMYLYVMAFVAPQVPAHQEVEFRGHVDTLRTISIQLVVAFLRDEAAKREILKVDFGKAIREISLIVKTMFATAHT
jgi:hypothetical protein